MYAVVRCDGWGLAYQIMARSVSGVKCCWLASGGHAVVEVPNAASLGPRVFGQYFHRLTDHGAELATTVLTSSLGAGVLKLGLKIVTPLPSGDGPGR